MTDAEPRLHLSLPPQSTPSLQAPWVQALLRSGASLVGPETQAARVTDAAKDAVHYVLCGYGHGQSAEGADFLAAVAKAHSLVAAGARRIVFLTADDGQTPKLAAKDWPTDKPHDLYHSLLSFSRHAGRALARRAEFTVVPVAQAPKSDAPPLPRSA
jgi:hypothetical protein